MILRLITSTLLLLMPFFSLVTAQGVQFDRDFAPSEGMVKPQEVPTTHVSGRGTTLDLPTPDPNRWEAVSIKIPSPWNVNAVLHDESGQGMDSRSYPSYPESWNDARMGWLRKVTVVPAAWEGKRTYIHLKAVVGDCRIIVNGREITLHFDNALPGEYDITSAIEWGKENTILLGIRDPKLYAEAGSYGSYNPPL